MIRSALSRPPFWIGGLAGAAAALGGLYLRLVPLAPVMHDEVEHLHVGFKMMQGLLPYVDFYQNHMPAYWLSSMLIVEWFPLSANAVLAGRATSTLALLGCWLVGLRLLAAMPAGRTWLARLVYTWAVIILAYAFELYLARPDPLMALFATASLCLLPMRGNLTIARGGAVGLLAGLSAAVSLKVLPVLLVPPAWMLVRCLRERRAGPAAALPAYGLGVTLALLPTLLWLLHHDMLAAFHFDVIALNQALSKPSAATLGFLFSPLAFVSALGALAWVWSERRRPRRAGNGATILALWLAAGVVLGLLARHTAPYNLQLLLVPLSIGTASLLTALWMRVAERPFRLLVLGAVVVLPTFQAAWRLGHLRAPAGIPASRFRALVALAEPGDRTCTGFAPWHPIFCRDVSGLSNGWDILFVERIGDLKQRERFRRLWREGVEQVIAKRPHLIVRRDETDIWRRAVAAGALTPAELESLEALEPEYESVRIGAAEIWVRRDDPAPG